MPRYKLILKQETTPDTNEIHGIRSFPDQSNQPFIDQSGNIDMSSNTIHANKLDITDSTATILSYQNGNNRSYDDFYSGTQYQSDNNLVIGSIGGSNYQTVFGTIMDDRIMQLTDGNSIHTGPANNLIGKYVTKLKTNTTNAIDTHTYTTWLDQVKSLEPVTYVYGQGESAINTGKFDGVIKFPANASWDGIYDNNVSYQGFLPANIQKVYPPAVINSEARTDATGNPIYQQVDMSKLVPMCIGSIKQLDASITTLTTNLNKLTIDLASATAKITDLETLNLLNSWQINGDTATLSVLYTSKDGGDGFHNYLNKRKTLTSVKWGASQYNSSLPDINKKSLLSGQLTTILPNSTEIPSDTKFIYDFKELITNPEEPWNTTYTYSYYTIVSEELQEPIEAVNEQSGRFGLIYDTKLV